MKYYLYNVVSQKIFNKKIVFGFAIMIMSAICFFSYRIYRDNLIKEVFPFNMEDAEYIPDNYKKTISFLKNNLEKEEKFFTMTSEAAWYYFIDRPCPTRFSVVWFAMPYFYQKEIVEDLKNKNVKYILYRNKIWSNKIDGFSNEARLPIVIEYIKQDYVFFKKIDDNEIWITKRIE